jgi:hypothetical protein
MLLFYEKSRDFRKWEGGKVKKKINKNTFTPSRFSFQKTDSQILGDDSTKSPTSALFLIPSGVRTTRRSASNTLIAHGVFYKQDFADLSKL